MDLRARTSKFKLPREHGFWAMLLTVLGTALLRTPMSLAVLAALLATLTACVVMGGLSGHRIRRSPRAQLGSSALLAFAGWPVQIVGGADSAELCATTAVWLVLFVSASLLVRAAFARAARARQKALRASWLTAWALALCGGGFAALYALNQPVHATALGLGTLGCVLIAAARPSIKQLKPVGIALAVLMVSAGLVLSIGAGVA